MGRTGFGDEVVGVETSGRMTPRQFISVNVERFTAQHAAK